jgi:predicted nucleic acid-binding protein
LILLAIRERVILVLSQLILDETRRNLAEYTPEQVSYFDLIVENVPFEIVSVTEREILAASKIVARKDAPIVAAARKAKVDFLVTLDKKHLLDKPEISDFVGANVVTPMIAFSQMGTMNSI